MKTPKFKDAAGLSPVTKVPNSVLVSLFLSVCEEEAERDYVLLLQLAVPDPEKAGKLLRKALTSGRDFYAYYPGLEGSKEPADSALYIGAIPDGSLYLL